MLAGAFSPLKADQRARRRLQSFLEQDVDFGRCRSWNW
jgi:hypothetical protein